ncbi:MAG: STAS domain-containing protein [Dermatophilaceae bacterium]
MDRGRGGTGRRERAPQPQLPMHVVQTATGQVVTVCGRIDARTAAGVRDLLHRVVDTGSGDIVLLLAQAEVGDLTALGVLVGAHHRARRADRRLVVSEVSERTARVLRATHLDRVLVGVSEPTPTTVSPLTA